MLSESNLPEKRYIPATNNYIYQTKEREGGRKRVEQDIKRNGREGIYEHL